MCGFPAPKLPLPFLAFHTFFTPQIRQNRSVDGIRFVVALNFLQSHLPQSFTSRVFLEALLQKSQFIISYLFLCLFKRDLQELSNFQVKSEALGLTRRGRDAVVGEPEGLKILLQRPKGLSSLSGLFLFSVIPVPTTFLMTLRIRPRWSRGEAALWVWFRRAAAKALTWKAGLRTAWPGSVASP